MVTLGSKGAAVYENGNVRYIPAIKTKVVDTTGAGDCFTAALSVKLLQGATLFEAAEFANTAAAVAVARRFAVNAMPKLEEL